MKEVKHSSFKVSDQYCVKHCVSKKQVLGSLLGEKNREKKEERYREIDCFYDPSLTLGNGKKITQMQWIRILEENGVKVSLETFKRYLKERFFIRCPPPYVKIPLKFPRPLIPLLCFLLRREIKPSNNNGLIF